MSDETRSPGDPIEMMRGAYAQAIERWSAAMEEVTGHEGFAAASENLFGTSQQQESLRAQAVERWSKAMEEIVGGEGFAAVSGQLLALYAQQQQSLRAASRVLAESIQMPTTEDLAEVAQLVINVERKVEEAADRAEDAAVRLSAIEARLGEATEVAHTIPARLAAIEERVAQAASASQALSDRLIPLEAALRELASGRAAAPGSDAPPVAKRAAPKTTSGTGPPSEAKEPSAKKPSAPKGAPARRRTPPADA